MIKKIKENKKGFTLVELIVVLVIIAILAALLIPALTGYIDKAKEKDIIAETRSTVMATQTLVDEAYAGVDVDSNDVQVGSATAKVNVTKEEIAKLAEVDVKNIGDVTVNKGKVTSLKYTKNGKTCTYTYAGNKGAYAVSK